MQIVQGGIVFIDGKFREGFSLLIKQGKIAAIIDKQASSDGEVIDAGGNFVTPGFIDLHTHGCNGADTMDGTVEAIQAMSAFWPAHGTTSFLPTTMTAAAQSIRNSIAAVFRAMKMPSGADILGINLEGPFLCSRAKGAHMEELIVNPSVSFYQSILPENMDIVKIVTVAPDAPDAEELIRYLTENGVVASIGHTIATYEQCQAAFKNGARHCTHFYNAMSPLKHREPGAVGALLENEDATIELIADLIHVHPAALKLAYGLKSSSLIVLITDSTVATGLKDGKYICGGLEVSVQEGSVRLLDGTLAGSILTLDQALRNMTKIGIPMESCIPMLTETPARIVGAGSCKGRIAKGYDADLVILDKNLTVKGTMVKGIWRYGFQGDCSKRLKLTES
ncbi:MAG: N-acetylglucosamine-6-phosphate deacetylase [Thermoclostridium sp.]|nr:N-acetylglucosamine-6-phosphate deacetylase [Thermoclostridium sp.]